MSFPIDLSRSLALMPVNVPVVVRRIPFDTLRHHCDEQGLREGDVVTSEVDAVDHVMLAKLDGNHVLLEKRLALLIEAERLERSTAAPA